MPVVIDRDLPVAYPGKQAFHEPVALRQLVQRLDGAPTEQAKISNVLGNRYLGQAVDNPIKPMCRSFFEPGFPLSAAPAHVDNIGALAPGFEHGGYQLRWILQVRINQDHSVAARQLQTGAHGRFLAEISTQSCDAYSRMRSLQFFENAQRLVLAAVIHIDDFPTALDIGQRGQQARMKNRQHVFFVIGRHHNAQGAR